MFILFFIFLNFSTLYSLSDFYREKGFCYLHEVDPSIRVSLRYNSSENFVGKPINGYKKDSVILTKKAALALKDAQKEFLKDGYSLVVYDSYRPKKAVLNFVEWSKNLSDQVCKANYYPRVDKSKLFDLGYISSYSSHSRGSCVDVTIIKSKNSLHAIKILKRKLLDGFVINFLDDGTLDMGSSFDLFDEASYTDTALVIKKYKRRRAYLKNILEKNGFSNYSKEWWHFTLKGEPFSKDKLENYFEFDVI